MDIYLYNTLTREKEIFKPLEDKKIGFYACGPTVYWFAHLGNLRSYVFEDILRRVLEYNGYSVKHIMNITDVGHLTSDADTGEDKLEKGAKRENKTVWEVAEFYTGAFKKDLKALNIIEPSVWCKATDHIPEMIDLIKKLEEKGVTYRLEDGIYFDTSKIENYSRLSGQNLEELKAGARVEMVAGKKNPTDFALWKFSPNPPVGGEKRQMEWDSPWGTGFPGWHIECSAMAMKYLGETFDIHCGGIDHISVHHTNEIAQSETATGKKFANYWLHNEFLVSGKEKMAKSSGSIATLSELVEKEFNPLAYRYLCLTAHYRSPLQFSWESIEASQNALEKMFETVRGLENPPSFRQSGTSEGQSYKQKFLEAINDDLNTSKALALTWDLIKDKEIADSDKKTLLLDFDRIFGFGLDKIKKAEIPDEITALAKERQKARENKDWQKADEIRKEIEEKGFLVKDLENDKFEIVEK